MDLRNISLRLQRETEMAGRPGFFGGAHQTETAEREPDLMVGPGGLVGAVPVIRLGDPNAQRPNDGFNTPPGFDPVWGTLGAPAAHTGDDWLVRSDDTADGVAVGVEVFGNGFQVSGQIRTGQFDRLSDWINMQTGFIQVQNASHVHHGQGRTNSCRSFAGGARPDRGSRASGRQRGG
jgi:hypothetical protein